MKKLLSLLLSCAMLLALAACGGGTGDTQESPSSSPAAENTESSTPEAEPVELIVFAAAFMTETLTEIADLYAEVAPNVTLTFNFDSSGKLVDQIEAGADCDIFISAAQTQMNEIDSTQGEDTNPEGYDFVLQGTRINLLENKVALAVPEGNPADINTFSDLTTDKLTLLAIGNSDVPVGQYTLEILEYLGTSAEELEAQGKLTYGGNVKEVTTQVKEAAADAGIIYATDAFSDGLTVVDTATTDMCGQVIYPAAVLNITQHEAEAQAFLDYLQTDEAMAVFEAVGFSPAE